MDERLWRHQGAPAPTLLQRATLSVIVGLGLAALVRLADWWFRPAHVQHTFLFVVLFPLRWFGRTHATKRWPARVVPARRSPGHL